MRKSFREHTRESALATLLEPIKLDWSSGIRARQALVISRRAHVKAAYPFMTDEEKAKADEWFKNESHEGLWD